MTTSSLHSKPSEPLPPLSSSSSPDPRSTATIPSCHCVEAPLVSLYDGNPLIRYVDLLRIQMQRFRTSHCTCRLCSQRHAKISILSSLCISFCYTLSNIEILCLFDHADVVQVMPGITLSRPPLYFICGRRAILLSDKVHVRRLRIVQWVIIMQRCVEQSTINARRMRGASSRSYRWSYDMVILAGQRRGRGDGKKRGPTKQG